MQSNLCPSAITSFGFAALTEVALYKFLRNT